MTLAALPVGAIKTELIFTFQRLLTKVATKVVFPVPANPFNRNTSSFFPSKTKLASLLRASPCFKVGVWGNFSVKIFKNPGALKSFMSAKYSGLF